MTEGGEVPGATGDRGTHVLEEGSPGRGGNMSYLEWKRTRLGGAQMPITTQEGRQGPKWAPCCGRTGRVQVGPETERLLNFCALSASLASPSADPDALVERELAAGQHP